MHRARPWQRILVLVVFLILYASLYPWEFQARELPANPLWILLHSWPARLDGTAIGDGVLNFVVYVPLGAMAFLALGNRIAAAVALAGVLSGSVELLQLFDRSRATSCYDLVMNVAGAAAGAALARMRRPLLARLERQAGLAAPLCGPALLLLCWAGYQLFPLVPSLSGARLAAKLTALATTPPAAALEALGAVVSCLAVARLLEGSGGPRRLRKPLFLALLLLPARLAIASRFVTWPLLAGAAAAWFCWTGWLWNRPRRTVLLAWLAAGAVVLRQLDPFRFTHRDGAFNWIPFASFLHADPGQALMVLFGKAFEYGAAAWLAHAAGLRWSTCAAGAAAVLGITEWLQLYLDGRTAEITDPVLAALLILVLALLEGKAGVSLQRASAGNAGPR